MNIAIVFAGGTGQRMNLGTRPKQFLELHGKPIIIYTLELFENSPSVDYIILVMLNEWIEYASELIKQYNITKVKKIISGGKTGQESIFRGVNCAYDNCPHNSVVLVHDGVRPLIDIQTIEECIKTTQIRGSAITISPAIETIGLIDCDSRVDTILQRSNCVIAKAPQCFILEDLYTNHKMAVKDGLFDFIDSASLMQHYGVELNTVKGPIENIKITTPMDYYVFRALVEAKENSQIFGL